MSNIHRLLPVATDITRPYWDAAAKNSLVIQHCPACGKNQFYPRGFCISCLSPDIEWKECSGKGKIYTFTVNHRAPNPYMEQKLPYVVAMIELDEGTRMMTNIVDSPIAEVKIGKRVKVVFEKISETMSLPQFTLDPQG
ncbi:Zn-ribbon domain-containing OB-fold protein [Lacisediminimonas profundi]|uniref:Zn-ribbon domain-containing OB-fold protein n=1 Tax=Lacisediminimonas profundi TaxID=2603856 RepID=UPI00124AFE61|nr:Zn-ribbon domain-containing OB-fold protein [Lacisediminimonas profundi]